MRLDGVRACVFDAYGTLFDFASAAARCEDIPEDKRTGLTALWRDKQLQYTWLRSLQGDYADFWQVTGDALDFTLDSLGIATPALRARLMELYLTLSAILSADAVKVFKTDPRIYDYGLKQLGLQAREVAFQSSNAWDAYAASAFGMRVIWCNRYGQRAERLPGQPDAEIRSLAELPQLLGLA